MRAFFLVVVVTALTPAALAAKIAVFAPTPGAGLGAKEALAFGDAVAAIASRAGHDVVTQQQLEALVGLEAAKQMAGCDAGSCSAEIGAALGVAAVVNLSVSEVGQSLVVTVKRTDVAGGSGKVADKRIPRGKRAKDLGLDALPALVAEVLVGLAPATTSTTTATTTATTTSTATAGKMPQLRRTQKVQTPVGLAWLDDGKGNLVAFVADNGYGGALFGGTVAGGMFQLRPGAGASADGEGGFSRSLWDPRVGNASFDKKAGVFTLTCGEKTTTLQPLKKGPAAVFHGPLWQRQGLLVGRDDSLRYFVVDAERPGEGEDRDAPRDRRLYVGKKGKLVVVDAEIDSDDSFGFGGVIAVTDGLTVKLGPSGGVAVAGATSTALTSLDLYVAGKQLYSELKPWGEGPLGTPCDSSFLP